MARITLTDNQCEIIKYRIDMPDCIMQSIAPQWATPPETEEEKERAKVLEDEYSDSCKKVSLQVDKKFIDFDDLSEFDTDNLWDAIEGSVFLIIQEGAIDPFLTQSNRYWKNPQGEVIDQYIHSITTQKYWGYRRSMDALHAKMTQATGRDLDYPDCTL